MMDKNTWQRLEQLFSESPVMRAEGVDRTEIEIASAVLGIPFPEDYIEFVHRYGGAIVGSASVIGLRHATPMGADEASVVDVTKRFRDDGWVGTEKWAVISIDHSGNPIGLDEEGVVWLSDHDSGEITQLADSFESFVGNYCLGGDS
jgi:hypothetical protein